MLQVAGINGKSGGFPFTFSSGTEHASVLVFFFILYSHVPIIQSDYDCSKRLNLTASPRSIAGVRKMGFNKVVVGIFDFNRWRCNVSQCLHIRFVYVRWAIASVIQTVKIVSCKLHSDFAVLKVNIFIH